MEELEVIARIAELGMNAVLLVILFTLWKDYREQNKFIRDQLLEADAERRVLASRMGIDTVTFKAEAQAIRNDIASRQSPN